jgi:hypothetical protein
VGHFRVYELLKFLMLVGKVLDSPLQCHTHLFLKDEKLDH